MYNYLYKITNILNGKVYIGVHKTRNLKDNYMGSGKRIKYAIRKYGINNFKKEILEFFNTFEEALLRESEIVTWEFLENKKVYNIKPGGKGGFSKEDALKGSKKGARVSGDKAKDLFSKGDKDYIERMHTQSKLGVDAYRAKYKENNGIWWENRFKGKTHNDETLSKMRGPRPQSSGSKNSQHGTCWITNGTYNKKIKKEELSNFISQGWCKGRKF